MPQSYRTVSKTAETEIVIQKSRFIGRCYPVQAEGQAQALLADIRKCAWDASHNCFAYSLGARGDIARYSDDGEPGGTAGLPMMETLRHKRVTDILVVVTRYFGGVLLGAGGLARAYAKAAGGAIDAGEPVWMRPCAMYAMEIDYARWGAMEAVLRGYGQVRVLYEEVVRAQALVQKAEEDAFIKAALAHSDGRVLPNKIGECYGSFPLGEEDGVDRRPNGGDTHQS